MKKQFALSVLAVVTSVSFSAQAGLLEGVVDSISADGVISGWACDTNTPTQSPVLHVYVDASPLSPLVVKPNRARPDLLTAGKTVGCEKSSGFKFILPGEFRDGQAHQIRIFALDTAGIKNEELYRSNQVVRINKKVVPDSSYVNMAFYGGAGDLVGQGDSLNVLTAHPSVDLTQLVGTQITSFDFKAEVYGAPVRVDVMLDDKVLTTVTVKPTAPGTVVDVGQMENYYINLNQYIGLDFGKLSLRPRNGDMYMRFIGVRFGQSL